MVEREIFITFARGRIQFPPTVIKPKYMKEWTLDVIIAYFDHFLKDVDFAQLPEKESEEYRQLVLKTANDVMFKEGRYSQITEYTLEIFNESEVCSLVRNLSEINQLSAAERVRLGFYLDVKEVCYPLFRGKKVDWSAWPWNLSKGDASFENQELFDLITKGDSHIGQPLPYLSAAILYDLEQQIWKDEKFYSCVARQEASMAFEYPLNRTWRDRLKSGEEKKDLVAAVNKCANDLWAIENHTLVGQMLGFDWLTQSVYDAFDTFIDSTYRHNQVLCARELSAWLKEHWTMDEPHPAQEKIDALYAELKAVMEKYDVTTPDMRYTWNLLTLEALGMSMFSEEEEVDDDPWGEDEFNA